MKETFFQFLLKRAATLCLALAAVCTTSLTLNSCGGGGESEDSRGTLTYRQFINGSKVIYLQAGSGLVLRGDPDLQSSGSQPWGYAFPAQLGIGAIPGPEYQASFFNLHIPTDEDSKMSGVVSFKVGYAGYTYSRDGGFPAFLGFPSSLNPQLQLAGPLELILDFDTFTWKTHIPDGSTITFSNGGISHVFGSGEGTTELAQDREGSFDVMGL